VAASSGRSSSHRRNSTEELSRWINRFSKAKIASRKQQDLRREVLLHNAYIRAQTEIKTRQEERQKRWKELKPLFRLETYGAEIKMAAMNDKMAPVQYKMADEDMEVERPSTPLPSVGAVKRNRCGCSPLMKCHCFKEVSQLSSKKFRPSTTAHDDDADDDLKSLDQFLSSLHFDWETAYDNHLSPSDWNSGLIRNVAPYSPTLRYSTTLHWRTRLLSTLQPNRTTTGPLENYHDNQVHHEY